VPRDRGCYVRLLAPMVFVFCGALALSACGGSSTPRVLTSADIPSYLGVRPMGSASLSVPLQVVARSHDCTTAGVVVFRTGAINGNPSTAKSLQVVSAALSCPSAADAEGTYGILVTGTGGGRSVPGLGDEAKLFNLSKSAGDRLYQVVWRQGNHVGLVDVGGPPNATRVTASLTQLLSRRALARVS
jgi:hypothetical protein